MAYEGLMVSVSGVRGRVGEALTPEIIAKFAAGFGAWALARTGGKARIVVGRDSRVSGPMFQPVVHDEARQLPGDLEHEPGRRSMKKLSARLMMDVELVNDGPVTLWLER